MAHRQEIIDAAIRVFAQKGFFNATLDEIAQEAEFSKGALYLHFSSKEDLLFSIMKEKFTDIIMFFEKALSGKSSIREELRELFRGFAELSFREKDFIGIFTSQLAGRFETLSPERAAELREIHDKFLKITESRVLLAQKEDELRTIPPEAVNGLIHGSLENMLITRWDCVTLEELYKGIDMYMDMLFNGISKKRRQHSEE